MGKRLDISYLHTNTISSQLEQISLKMQKVTNINMVWRKELLGMMARDVNSYSNYDKQNGNASNNKKQNHDRKPIMLILSMLKGAEILDQKHTRIYAYYSTTLYTEQMKSIKMPADR